MLSKEALYNGASQLNFWLDQLVAMEKRLKRLKLIDKNAEPREIRYAIEVY